ncbi:MAG: oligosaccharyl transferase, archaeosortase A system-associated [Methanomicrobiales archaeon]|nr:oligosaccharyl transferase, archaeosortase A system-associated [Methanomicrobiales archaeon]
MKILFGKYRHLLVPGILLAFFLFALALRGIPALYTPPGGFLPVYDSDSWYTLRQVEVMVHAFPQYNWFDPMTAYPNGKFIDWGPLYPALAATLSLLTGATTRSGIIATSMWLGPIMGACMVPVMYMLGKVIWNRRGGLVAAALVSFTSFRLFFLSSYGFVDHHIAEVLATSLFLLVYCFTLLYGREHPPDFSRPSSLLPVGALSLLGGLLFLAGILASTTVVLVVLAIGIYTAIQVTIDAIGGRPSFYLVLMHAGIFGTASLGLLAFGIRAEGLSLVQYSVGHVYACGAIIAETILLFAISRAARGRKATYLASLAGLGVAGTLMVLLVPPLQAIASQAIGFLIGADAYSLAIQEMQPWSLTSAWRNFNTLPLLMAGGFLILALSLKKERRQEGMFIAVWAAFLLALTILHNRFEYYLAMPLILLSALCIVETWGMGSPGLRAWVAERIAGAAPRAPIGERNRETRGPRQKPAEKRKRARNTERPAKTDSGDRKRRISTLLAAAVLILVASGAVISLVQDIQFGMNVPYREIHGDWMESLLWMEGQTPFPGVDYFGRYDPENFSYPAGSYGVLATWDAGHWITFFSHRIPNMNPFQDNLMGPGGGAAFFLAPSEEQAGTILTGLGTRYVITDAWTATDRFTALLPWVDPSVDTTPYIAYYFIPDTADRSNLLLDSYYTDGYYRSMVVRLHFFDGSMALPTTVKYIEYTIRNVPGEGETAPMNTVGPVITRIQDLDAAAAAEKATSVNADPLKGYHAAVLSEMPDLPTTEIPALSRFRLIHESPSNISWEGNSSESPPEDVRYVKVFEYVWGAHIRGTGIIELPLVTNTGRTFTYRQESVNGEFVVPYSTQENPYDVKATGPYRIAGSTASFEVSEEDVLAGRTVGS